MKLDGEEDLHTLKAANNYAAMLVHCKRFDEAKSLLRKVLPVARRVFGENAEITLKMRPVFAQARYEDPDATVDDLREAVATLEEAAPIARRVFGGANPLTDIIEGSLRQSQVALAARVVAARLGALAL